MFRRTGTKGRRRAALFGLLLTAGVGAAGCNAPQTPPQPLDPIQRVWTDYRDHHPFHAQEVAVSEPNGDEGRILILSEPPDGVTPATLKDIHPALGALVTKRHPIGVDGWTEDLVGVLPPMSQEALSELTSELHVALFGTSYHARLSPIAPRKWRGTLDVEVRPRELHDWVLGDRAMFWPVDGGPAELGSDLLAPAQTGVYLSKTPGIVVWSFPKNEPFDEQRANVRIFGVESDLVLGAFADEDSVLVVGRERVAPIEAVPPLRFETVKILATAPLRELRQSYERQQLFAGPMPNGKDWAPILLSPPIVDTELGSTLDIADQLLKRWSLNGNIDYERFDYAGEPRKWAFDQPISKELGATTLTFNWNTAESGGLVELPGDRQLYWMNRTGALHVSYLPGDRPDPATREYEDRAREFFAHQADPYLVRAVQYTTLFQAFRQLGVVKLDPAADAEDLLGASAANQTLEDAGTEVLTRLLTMDDAAMLAAGRRVADHDFANMSVDAFKRLMIEALEHDPEATDRAVLVRRIQAASDERTLAALEDVKASMAADVAVAASVLKGKLSKSGDPQAAHLLSVALVHSGLVTAMTRKSAQWADLHAALRTPAARKKADELVAAAVFLRDSGLQMSDAQSFRDTILALSDNELVEKRYRALVASRPARGRVRTPSVVWSSGAKIKVHGGHNMGSSVAFLPRLVAPAELGAVRVSREGLFVAPTVEVPRARVEALGPIPERPAPAAPVAAGARPLSPIGGEMGSRRLLEEPSATGTSADVVIRPYDASAGYKVDVGGSVFEANSKTDIADTVFRNFERQARVGGKKPLTMDIHLQDAQMSPDEARGVAQSVHNRLQRRSFTADEAYVFQRGEGTDSLSGYDLSRAVVSEPIRKAGTYKIRVSIPRNQGAIGSLFVSIFGEGEPPADAAAATEAAIKSGVRPAADIARDIQHRFGKSDHVLLLELAIDALPDITDNDAVTPRGRSAGTTSHTF